MILLKKNDNKISGNLKIDKTIFGSEQKGKRGWGTKGKHIVFGIYKRNGQIINHIIKSRESLIIPLICQTTASGSLYYADDWYVYAFLPIRGE